MAATVLVGGGVARAQQDLGHKTLGTLGLDAGTQAPTGVYAVEGVVGYGADRIVDRNGAPLPLDVDARAFANQFGVGGTYEIRALHTFVSAAVAMPVARVVVDTDDARASLDRLGFGDLYAQPLKLGWRLRRLDLVAAYAFYAPTGRFEPGGRGGVGRGQWTHQWSTGATVYLDRARRWRLSALASWEHNERKLGVDLRRGDTMQVQGGAGAHLARILDLGLAGYALWQVTDDSGGALPSVLSGARDNVYGLGPELDVTARALCTRLTVRYTHDVAARSRPFGGLVVLQLTISAWSAR